MHQRKERLAQQADAFIALPGGFGTFEELFEILTWSQIGLHTKPVGVLNVLGYFDPLLSMVTHALREGFIYQEHQQLLAACDNPAGSTDSPGKSPPSRGFGALVNPRKWIVICGIICLLGEFGGIYQTGYCFLLMNRAVQFPFRT